MIPLVDIHCHLLAGLDDGPRTEDDALDMCRAAYADGIRLAAAGAHQNERWKQVTPDGIRDATRHLTRRLQEASVPLSIFPCAEVMVDPDIEASWRSGEILSVADRGQHLLVEMPHGLFVDLRPIVANLRARGICPILAHPERHPELLHDADRIVEFIRAGCLVQVSAKSVTDPASRRDARALKCWLQRGIVHFLGSDGHSPRRRPPLMADAYRQVRNWAGAAVADQVCSTNGMAVAHGWPLRLSAPKPTRARWSLRIW